MQIVPLQAIPNQAVLVTLNSQNTQINVYQKSTGLFVDVYLNNGPDPIVAGVLGENLRLIIMSAYLGYSGDFMFLDNQGSDDPFYSGLGARFSLVYLAPSDIPSTSLYQ